VEGPPAVTTKPEDEDAPSPAFQRGVLVAMVVLSAAGLAASTALLIDYLRPAPLFCGDGGGCGALKHSEWAAWFGIPTPVFGVLGFLVLGGLTLTRGEIVRFVHLVVATAGACFAAYLIFLQITLGHICPYCMVTDVSSIALVPLALLRLRNDVDAPREPAKLGGIATVYLAALAAPFMIHALNKPKLPQVVAEEIRATGPGRVTVVDFADFECPFCRKTHAKLEPLVTAYGARVRVVRKHVPLAHIHPHAMDAAKAACCAERMGHTDDMADALFEAPLDQLTPEGCSDIASQLGMDRAAFRACLDDPAIAARIEADRAAFKSTGAHGLPTIFVNDQRIEGAQDDAAYRDAFKREFGE
jgi:protein-disulfide isomerase/uncharacterized membrane protein